MTTVDKSRFRPTPVLRPRRRRLMARVRMVDGAGLARDVVVENVSLSGVQALAPDGPPAVGDMVTLDLAPGQSLWGVVRWTDGKRFGVEVDNAATAPEPAAEAAAPAAQSMCLRPTRR